MNPATEIRPASLRRLGPGRCPSSASSQSSAAPVPAQPCPPGEAQSGDVGLDAEQVAAGPQQPTAWPRIATVAGPLRTSPAPGRRRRRARRHRRQPRSRRCGAAGQSSQESARAASQVHDCGTGDDPGHVPQTGLVLEGAGRHRVVPGQLGLVKGVAVLRHAVLPFGWIVRNWAFMVGALRWTGSLRAVSGTWPASVLVAVQASCRDGLGDFMGGG